MCYAHCFFILRIRNKFSYFYGSELCFKADLIFRRFGHNLPLTGKK